jgi:hypothetical protein
LCIFVLDLVPSNIGFGLRFKDFSWNPSLVLQLGCDSISGILVDLRLHVFGHSIPYGRFSFPENLVSILLAVWEIRGFEN